MTQRAARWHPGAWGVAATVATFVCTPSLRAQQIRIDDLRPPAAPAFVLLGVAPTLVERPTSPQALAVSLLSAGAAENLLPREYALEFTPFWLVPHPLLTYERYYRPTLTQAALQSLAISFATTPLADTADAGTALGVGARTLLLPGRPHPDLAARERALRAIQVTMNRIRDEAERELEPILQQLDDSVRALGLPDSIADRLVDSLSTARVKASVDDTLQKHEEAARNTALEMQELDKERVGWQVELAAGVVLEYPGNSADSARVGRAGVWLTVAHRLATPQLDLVGVARYRYDRRTGTTRNLLDYGARLGWEGKELTLSAEFVEYVGEAVPGGEKPGYRFGLNLEYRLGGWGALVATLANDDAADGSAGRRLVASLGINLGFGSLPIIVGPSAP